MAQSEKARRQLTWVNGDLRPPRENSSFEPILGPNTAGFGVQSHSKKEVVMKFANPAPLGLAGFALTTWMLSLVNAGWYDATAIPLVIATAVAFGGTAQFAAGLLEFPRGNTFGFVAFCAYGAFWWSFAVLVEFFPGKVPPAFVGWWLFMWGVFTFFMWVGTFRANKVLQLIFLALWITFVVLAAADWTGISVLRQLGGYMGLLTAALAFYLAAAEVINETRGNSVLPIGPYQDLLGAADRVQGAALATRRP